MTSLIKKAGIAVLVIVGVCIAGTAVIAYRAAMHAGNEAATVQNLMTIAAVEARYFYSHNRTFATLDQLLDEQSLSQKFRGHPAAADGYVFILTLAPKPDGSSTFTLTADPQNDNTGIKHFYVDSDDQRIRVNPQRQAGPADPCL